MDTCLFTFRSVTLAQRGERVLRSAGIPCQLRRTPRWMEQQGCGYCLKIPGDQGERAEVLLRGSEIPWRKRYRGDGGGNGEEAVP